MTIAILGGGLSGLALARLLHEKGNDIVVLEAETAHGGLCRSKTEEGFTFDIGGSHISCGAVDLIINQLVTGTCFDTSDAVKKAKDQNDNGIYMGEKSLRDIWSKEKAGHVSTVHEGDCVYKGDIRTLVGVVRWQKEGMRDLPKDYFVENLRADLLITGSSICQNPKM